MLLHLHRLVSLGLLAFGVGGCGGPDPNEPLMNEAVHSHYHVHAADASHGHAHDAFGGHTHSHTHSHNDAQL